MHIDASPAFEIWIAQFVRSIQPSSSSFLYGRFQK